MDFFVESFFFFLIFSKCFSMKKVEAVKKKIVHGTSILIKIDIPDVKAKCEMKLNVPRQYRTTRGPVMTHENATSSTYNILD